MKEKDSISINEDKQNKIAKWMVLFLICATFLVWIMAMSGNANLRVTFFDVGQGDSALIQTPQGRQILIDGGPNNSVLGKLGKELPFWDKEIDLIILTHPDRDHLAGLLAVLNSYRVDKIIWSGIANDSPEDQEWLRAIKNEGADVETAVNGEKFSFDGNQNDYVEIFTPGAGSEASLDKNENSVVARLVYGKRSFLFTGDIAAKEEEELDAEFPELSADVLKVAHHGSKYSTNETFLASLLPAAAIISVGKDNSYGHPTPQVLELLSKYDIKTLRTDLNGNVLFETDGNNLFVKTQK